MESQGLWSKGRTFANVLPYDPALALEGLREEEARGALKLTFAFRDYTDLETLPEAEADTLVEFAGGLPGDSGLRRACLRAAAEVFAQTDPSRAIGLLVSARPIEPNEEAEWADQTGKLLRDWVKRDTASATQWLDTNTELDPDILWDLARSAGLRPPVLTVPNPPIRP